MTHFKVVETSTRGLASEWTCPSTAEVFEGLIGDEYKSLARTIFALRRGPVRYTRNQIIALDGEVSDYIFLVISGVVRSFRSFQDGTRKIVAFYLPSEVFRAGQSFKAFVVRRSSHRCQYFIFQTHYAAFSCDARKPDRELSTNDDRK